jgi:Glycosyltransferase 61
MLDVSLWRRSLQLVESSVSGPASYALKELFSDEARHIFLPQSLKDFQVQTSRDVNRFLYALILQLDITRLYPNASAHDLQSAMPSNGPRVTVALLDAYPELLSDSRFLFRDDLLLNSSVDLVCTPRLTVGAKLADVGHERVCRAMRERSWAVFGIDPPPMVRAGQIFYPRPPLRVIVVQRHISRKFGNLDKLLSALGKELAAPHGVAVELVSTVDLQTAEQYVRIFSRAGVVVTPHGSQSMGQIWMPRYR